MTDRRFDVICLGRAAVDLYGLQKGGRLEDVQSFAKYLGGSSANLAAGLARLGMRSAMLTRVGHEQMGNFVREALAREGVDIGHVRTDPERLTALVVLGIQDKNRFPHIFFRENCADMALDTTDFDEDFIGDGRALAITGTHLSTDHTRRVCRYAIDLARRAGVRVILDIDYRPVLWGLTPAGDGESRFVASDTVSMHLQSFLRDCDLIIGTEEEMRIAAGRDNLHESLHAIRRHTDAVLVLKRGVQGCVVYDGDIPDKVDGGTHVPGFPVEVLNTLGAGDAFLSGFLYGWLDGLPFRDCGRLGNACGALVVSRHGCSPAMPGRPEVEEFLRRDGDLRRPDLDERLNYLHRATLRKSDPRDLFILAFDHRWQLEQPALEYEMSLERVNEFKMLIAAGVESLEAADTGGGRIGILVDERYGAGVLEHCIERGWWIGRPVEVPGSRPVQFEAGDAMGGSLGEWPAEHVVKCLIHYHPADPVELRLQQEDRIAALHAECVRLDRSLLLEVIAGSSGQRVDPETIAETMRRFYNLGVFPDWWKIEPPCADAWPRIVDVIDERDPNCCGVLLLGLDVPIDELEKGFAAAAPVSRCRGFAIGRSIFGPAFRPWLLREIDDGAAIGQIAENYRRVIAMWRQARAALPHGG